MQVEQFEQAKKCKKNINKPKKLHNTPLYMKGHSNYNNRYQIHEIHTPNLVSSKNTSFVNKSPTFKDTIQTDSFDQVIYCETDSDNQNLRINALRQQQCNSLRACKFKNPQIQMRNLTLERKSLNRSLSTDSIQGQINGIKEQLYELQLSGTSQSNKQKIHWQLNQDLKQKLKNYFEGYSRAEAKQGPKPQSLRQFSQQTFIPYSTLSRLFAKWRHDPTLLILEPTKNNKGKVMKKTQNRKQKILWILSVNPYFTANEIQRELVQHEDCLKKDKNGSLIKHISLKSIYRILHQQNYVFKRIQNVPTTVRNTKQNILKRFLYCLKIKQIVTNKQNRVFYIGSTLINMHIKRQKAWTKKGQQTLINLRNQKGKNMQIFAFIGNQGFVQSQMIVRSHNNSDFFATLSKMVSQVIEKARGKAKFLLMDSTFIEGREDTVQFVNNHSFSVIFLPPYSPQLNAVEQFLYEMKCEIKKHQFINQTNLFRITELVFKLFKSKRMEAYYNNVEKYIIRGIQKQSF